MIPLFNPKFICVAIVANDHPHQHPSAQESRLIRWIRPMNCWIHKMMNTHWLISSSFPLYWKPERDSALCCVLVAMSSQVNVAQRISKPRTTLPYMAVDFDKSSLASSSLERGGCCNGCCRGCLGKLPYGTITASLLSICGLCLAVAALFYITSIVDRAILDLFHKKYLWYASKAHPPRFFLD